jgi:glycosyltransferase involved in cell wall biosynthesis
MIKVAALTGKPNTPSTRFRILQYIEILNNYGIDIKVLNTSVGRYPQSKNVCGRVVFGIQNILENIPNVVKSYKYDVTFLQREMLSTFYTLERFTKNPRVFDVDDAIFIGRGEYAARKLAENCNKIICGNTYLANWFEKYNKNIIIIPTAVDASRYIPTSFIKRDKVYLVWSGSSSGYNFFLQSGLINALERLMVEYDYLYLRIIADNAPPNFVLPRLEFIQWNSKIEITAMNECDIGLMPLADNKFAQGKCSYKMLTYMSCSLPVVVSPVGMNKDVLNMGELGFAASTAAEWYEILKFLINNLDLGYKLGKNGRNVILSKFDIPIIARQIKDVFINF